MRKAGWIAVFLTLIAVLLCFWSLDHNIQTRVRSTFEETQQAVAKIVYGCYKRYVENLNRFIRAKALALLLEDPVGEGDFSVWTQTIRKGVWKTTPIYIWWVSPDGDLLHSWGLHQGSDEGLSSDPMFFTAKTGEEAVSDLCSIQDEVHIRTIIPVSFQAKKYMLCVGTQFGERFVREMKELSKSDVALLYGEKIFAASEPVYMRTDFEIPQDFLSTVKHKIEPDFQAVPYGASKYLMAVAPILDFEEWDIKGFIAISESERALHQQINKIRIQFWMSAIVAFTFISIGIVHVLKRVKHNLPQTAEGYWGMKRRFRKQIWLPGLFLLPVIGTLLYITSPVTSLMENLNAEKIRISALVAQEEVANWYRSLETSYGAAFEGAKNTADALHLVLELMKERGAFDFVILDQGSSLKVTGELDFDYADIKPHITKSADRISLIKYKGGAVLVAKETIPLGVLLYGYILAHDRLERMRERATTDFTVFIDDEPVSSTIEPRVLRTLTIRRAGTEPPSSGDGVTFAVGKLRRVTHRLATIHFLGQMVQSGGLMLSLDDTPYQNNVVGYWVTGVGVIVALSVVKGISLFVILNIHRPRLLRAVFTGCAFLSPSLAHLLWWAVGPLLFAAYLAFHRWSVISPARPFVGLDNFIELIHDKLFWHSLRNTVIYILHVPFGMALSLLIALAVNRRVRGIRLLRTVYYLPAVSSLVSTAIMWRWIFHSEFGIMNYFLSLFGLPKLPWLASPYLAMPAIMIMSVWMIMGQQMIIFLAGLQSIPSEYHDAASVDGANAFQRFWYITLPLLKPTTFFVLVTSIIGSFQVFTPVYVLTEGGPLRSTDVAVFHIWQTAWQELRMGYAAAQAWILFAIILIFTVVQFRLLGKEIRYV